MSTSDSKSGTFLERSYSSASSTTSSRRSARRKRKRIKHTVMPLKKRPGRHELACDVHRISNLDHEEMNQSACFWVAKNPEDTRERSFKEEVFVNRDEDLYDENGDYIMENVLSRQTDDVVISQTESPTGEGSYTEEKMFYGIRKGKISDGANVEQFSPLASPRPDSRLSSLSDDSHSALSSDGTGMHVGWTSDINSSGPEYSGITDEDSEDERGYRRPRRDLQSINDKWEESMESRGRRKKGQKPIVVAQDVTKFAPPEKESPEPPPDENPPAYNGHENYQGEVVTNGHTYPGENTQGTKYPLDTQHDVYSNKVPSDRGQSPVDNQVFQPSENNRGSEPPDQVRYPNNIPVDRNPSPINGRTSSPGTKKLGEVSERYERFVSSTLESSNYTAEVPGLVGRGPLSGGRTSTPNQEYPSSDTELLRGNEVDDDQLSHRSLPVINKRTNTKYYSVDELRKSVETEAKKDERDHAPLYVPRVSDEYMNYQPPRRVRARSDDPVGSGTEADGAPPNRYEEPKVLATGYEVVKQRSKFLVPGPDDDKENVNPSEDPNGTNKDTRDFEDSKEFYGYRREQSEESYSYSYSSVSDFNDKPRSRAPLRGGVKPSDEYLGYKGAKRDDNDNVVVGEAYVVDKRDKDYGERTWEESKEFHGYRRGQQDENYSNATPKYGEPREARDRKSAGPGQELIGKAEVQQTFASNEDHRSDDGNWQESKEFYGYRRLLEDGNYPYHTTNYPGEQPKDTSRERVGEEFIGMKNEKFSSNKDNRLTEGSKEFYGYRRVQGDHVYSHLTPKHVDSRGKERGTGEEFSEEKEKTTANSKEYQRDTWTESKEFYGYRSTAHDQDNKKDKQPVEDAPGRKDPDRMKTSGYEVHSQKAMYTKEVYNEQSRTDDQRTRGQYPRDYIPKDKPYDKTPRIPTGEVTTKRLHTRSERDTLRREGRWPSTKTSDNDVGMTMFKQRSLPRKHGHPPTTDGNKEMPKKSKKSTEPDLSKTDPEFADRFREITEKRKVKDATKTTEKTTKTRTETSTKKAPETSTKKAAETCNKNVDELVNVFSTLQNLQSQPGKREETNIPPGKVKQIVKEGKLESTLNEGKKLSPAASVSQKLEEIENILESVGKNNKQRMRTSQSSYLDSAKGTGQYQGDVYTTRERHTYREERESRETHTWNRDRRREKQGPGLVTKEDFTPVESYGSNRPWSYSNGYQVGSLSEGELLHDDVYTRDYRDERDTYRGNARKGRPRRKKDHSRAYSDGEIEEFRRPYQKRVITPGTPVNIRLYGLNLEKTKQDRSFEIDWEMFNEQKVPVSESVERSEKQPKPTELMAVDEPLFDRDYQSPRQPEFAPAIKQKDNVPGDERPSAAHEVGQDQEDSHRKTVRQEIIVTSVKRLSTKQTSDNQETRTNIMDKQPTDKVLPAKRPSETYPSEEQPPEKRYTEERRTEDLLSEDVPTKVVPMKEERAVDVEHEDVTMEPQDYGTPETRPKEESSESDYIELEVEHMDSEGNEVPPGGKSKKKRQYWEEHDESIEKNRSRVKSSSSEKRESSTCVESTTHTKHTTRTTRTTTEKKVVKKVTSSGGKSPTSDIVTRKDDQPEETPDEEPAREDEGTLVAHEYLEMNADTGRPVSLTMLGRVVEDEDEEMTSQTREDVFLHTRLKMVSEKKLSTDKVTKEDVDTTLRTSPTNDEDVDDEFADSEPESEDTLFIPVSKGAIVEENVEKFEERPRQMFPPDDIFKKKPTVNETITQDKQVKPENVPRDSLEEMFNPPTVEETEVQKATVPGKPFPTFEWIPNDGDKVNENVKAEQKPESSFELPEFEEPEISEVSPPKKEVDEQVVAEERCSGGRISPSAVNQLVEEEREPIVEGVEKDAIIPPEIPELGPQLPLVDETVTSEERKVEYEIPDIQPAQPESRPLALIDENITPPELIKKDVFIPDFQEFTPKPQPKSIVDETIFPPEKVSRDATTIDFQEVVSEFQESPMPSVIDETVPKSEKEEKQDLPEIEMESEETTSTDKEESPHEEHTDEISAVQEAVQEPPRRPQSDVIDGKPNKISDSCEEKESKKTEYFEVPRKMPVPETSVENEIVTETRTTKTVTIEKTFRKDVHYSPGTPPGKGRPVSPYSDGISETSSDTSLQSSTAGSADVSSEMDASLDVPRDETDNPAVARKRRNRRGNRFDKIKKSGHLVPDSVVTQAVAPEPECIAPNSVSVPREEIPVSSEPDVSTTKQTNWPSSFGLGREKPGRLRPEMYLLSSDDGSDNDTAKEIEIPVEEPEEIEKTEVMKPEMEPWKFEDEPKEEIDEVCEETVKEVPVLGTPLMEGSEGTRPELSQEDFDELLEKEVQGLPKDEADNLPQTAEKDFSEEDVLEKAQEDEMEEEESVASEVSEGFEKTFAEEKIESKEKAEEVPEEIEIPVEVKLIEEEPESSPEVAEDKEIPIQIINEASKEDEPMTSPTDDTIGAPGSDETSTKSTVETIIVEKTHSEISTTVTEISTKRYSSDRTISSSEDERDYVHIKIDVDDEPPKLRDVEYRPDDKVTTPDEVTTPDDVTESYEIVGTDEPTTPDEDTTPDKVTTLDELPTPDEVTTSDEKPESLDDDDDDKVTELMKVEMLPVVTDKDLPSRKEVEEMVEGLPVDRTTDESDRESEPSEITENVEKSSEEKQYELPEMEDMNVAEKEEVEKWLEKEEKIVDEEKPKELSEEMEKSPETEKQLEIEILDEVPQQVSEDEKEVPINVDGDLIEDDETVTSSTDDITVIRTDTSSEMSTKSTIETIIVEKTHSEISTTVTEISTKRISSDKTMGEDEQDYVDIPINVDNEQLKVCDDLGPDDQVTKPDDKPTIDDKDVDIPIDFEKVVQSDEAHLFETAPPQRSEVVPADDEHLPKDLEDGVDVTIEPKSNDTPVETVFAILDMNYEKSKTSDEIFVESSLSIGDSTDFTEKPLEVVQITRTSASSESSEDTSGSSVDTDKAPTPDDDQTGETVIISEDVPLSEQLPKPDDIPITEDAPTYEDKPIAELLQWADVPVTEDEPDGFPKTEGAPTYEDKPIAELLQWADVPITEDEPKFDDETTMTEVERIQMTEDESQTETDMCSETTQTEVTTKTTRETMTQEWREEHVTGSERELNDSEMQTQTEIANAAIQTDPETGSESMTEMITKRSEKTTKTSESSRYFEELQRKVDHTEDETQTEVIVDDFGSQTQTRDTSESSSMTDNIGGTVMIGEGTQTELIKDDEGYLNESEIIRITRKTTKETRREYSETSSKESSTKDLKSDCPVCQQSLESTQYSFIKVSDLSRYTAMEDFSCQTSFHETSEESHYCFACGRNTSSEEYWESRERVRRTEDQQEHSTSRWEQEVVVESETTTSEEGHFAIHVVGEGKCSLYCRRVGNHECMLQKLASIIKANRKATTADRGESTSAEELSEGGLDTNERESDSDAASATIGREFCDVSVQTDGAILPTDFEVFNESDFEIYYDEERSPSWFV